MTLPPEPLLVPFVVKVAVGPPVSLPRDVREVTACLESAVRSLAAEPSSGAKDPVTRP